jgi:putative ABC transport system permease protein
LNRPLRLYALRLAARELRGGIRGLRVFLACLILGVGAIAGIGSLAASLAAGITGDARELLGGDVEARLAYRPANAAERRYLERSGKLSEVALLRATARDRAGERHTLISLKAVDAAYPLYGNITLSPAQALGAALRREDAHFGAVVDPAILTRLGLGLGDRLDIGDAVLQIRAVFKNEPDAAEVGFVLGPRVLISIAALAETGLTQPGALVTYSYRLRLPANADAARWAAQTRAAFPEAGWEIRTFAAASPELRRLIDRVGLYLSLVGLTTLLVGGVGIGNAVGFHIAGKTATIATLRCLGASARLVFAAFFAEIMVLAGAGIAAGLVLGGLMPAAAAPFLKDVLPVSVRLGLYPRPLLLAALSGLLAMLVFSLWPLAGVRRVPAGALFRSTIARLPRQFSVAVSGATAISGLALAALVIAGTREHDLAAWFVLGTVAAFAAFRAAGAGIACAAARLRRPHHPMLRLAFANLHRPGAATMPVVLSLGLGLTVLVAISLVEGNLAREVERRIPAEAPASFFIDIQPDELAGFAAIVRGIPGARFAEVPMMRGRITRLNGVPVDRAAVAPGSRWALNSDRGLTYAATLPAGSRLVAGRWWPPDYRGPPLVSFDAALARGMGLKIGDTLSVNLLGREITARIANLRDIDWQQLGINFVMIFAPGTLEKAPQTHLAAVYLPSDQEDRLVVRVTRRFPNISAIEVGEALAAVDHVIGVIGAAVRATALCAVAAGALVLGGAIAAGQHRRVYDAVVLKVLGATRGAIIGAYLVENGLLGALSAVIAATLGTLAAYLVVTRLLETDWVFLPLPLLWTVAAATLLALALGFAGTWRALAARPARHLRNE